MTSTTPPGSGPPSDGAQIEITVPDGPVPPQAILPLARALMDGLVAAAVEDVSRRGLSVSCRAGCGACCRQLVMISEVEARALDELVSEMPAQRRDEVEARFADAHARMDAAGLASAIRRPGLVADADFLRVSLAYFRLGIPCPFLEAESCSIHPDRPLACREYLVTSPPEECARVWEGGIDGVDVSQRVSTALADIPAVPQPHRASHVPLVFALAWSRGSPRVPQYDPQVLFGRFLRDVAEEGGGEGGAPSGAEGST